MGYTKDVLKFLDALDALSYFTSELLYCYYCYYSTCYDNVITFCYMLLHYITLDLYYDVFIALTNPSSQDGNNKEK